MKGSVRKAYMFGSAFVVILLIGVSLGVMISADTPTGFPTVIEPGSNVNLPKYVVYGDNASTYFVKDGLTGQIVDTDTNATAIINLALDSLSPGRNVIEKIALTGKFTLGYPILVPSYSHIEIEGSLFLANGANTNLIQNKNSQDQYIELSGNGVLSGNKNNQVSGHGISFTKVTNSTVSGIRIFSFKEDGIRLDNTGIGDGRSYIRIFDVESTGNGYDGIGLNVSRYFITVNNCITKYNGANGIFLGAPFHCLIETSHSYWNTKSGIYLNSPTECIINGNSVGGNVLYGIHLFGGASNVVSSNQGSSNNIGLRNWGSYANVIIGNGIHDNVAYNIVLDHASTDNCSVIGNELTSVISYGTDYGIYIGSAGCSDNLIEGNILQAVGRAFDISGIYNAGTNTIIRDNIGYVTEAHNSISVTGAVNLVVVTHGLVTIPVYVSVIGNNSGIGNVNVSSFTTTQFTIYFENQPGTSEWRFYWYAQTW